MSTIDLDAIRNRNNHRRQFVKSLSLEQEISDIDVLVHEVEVLQRALECVADERLEKIDSIINPQGCFECPAVGDETACTPDKSFDCKQSIITHFTAQARRELEGK